MSYHCWKHFGGVVYFLLLWHTWDGEEVGSMERLRRSWGRRGARAGDDPMGTNGRGGRGMFLFLGWMVLIPGPGGQPGVLTGSRG